MRFKGQSVLGGETMVELSERLKSRLEIVLEETCRELPNGGDHDTRRFIAERLLKAALDGHQTIGELGIIARKAAADANITEGPL